MSGPAGGGPPVTPDGRYLVVRGRLWRRSDPALGPAERERLTTELMAARRAEGAALRAGDDEARERARARVDAAKHALGERGPVWWDDGVPDLTRHLARTTAYATWWAQQEAGAGPVPPGTRPTRPVPSSPSSPSPPSSPSSLSPQSPRRG